MQSCCVNFICSTETLSLSPNEWLGKTARLVERVDSILKRSDGSGFDVSGDFGVGFHFVDDGFEFGWKFDARQDPLQPSLEVKQRQISVTHLIAKNEVALRG